MVTEGALDTPTELSGTVLAIAGWVIFESGPAVRVTAFVDGASHAVRANVPRPDLTAHLGAMSAAAGFQSWVEPRLAPGERRPVTVAVRAEGPRGELWHTPDRTVMVSRPPGSEAMAAAAARVAAAGRAVASEPSKQRAPGPLRLCFFVHDLALGGGQLWMQDLLMRLAADDLAAIWVVSPQDGVLRADLEAAGVSVHLTGAFSVDANLYAGRVVELAALLRLWSIDAVLVNTMGLVTAADAAVVAGVPFIWAIHESYGVPEYALLGLGLANLDPALESRWLGALEAAQLLFVSDSTSDLVGAYAPSSTRATVRYGIDRTAIDTYRADHDRDADRARLGWGPGNSVLLCMGIFGERKAVVALVIAFARISRSFPAARLVLVGADVGHYSRLVRSLVAELGLADQVSIVPIAEDTYQWFSVADVLVSASDVESLPRSMIEALAFGVPVASVDVFGVSELVIDGETGWLCAPRDIDALATCFRRVLDTSAEERRRMAEQCRNHPSGHAGTDFAVEIAGMLRTMAGGGE